MTIAFVQELLSRPPDGVVFFDIGPCDLADPGCTSCPGIVETEDTTPPLSYFRRNSIMITVWGRADTPTDLSTWGKLKSLFE